MTKLRSLNLKNETQEGLCAVGPESHTQKHSVPSTGEATEPPPRGGGSANQKELPQQLGGARTEGTRVSHAGQCMLLSLTMELWGTFI